MPCGSATASSCCRRGRPGFSPRRTSIYHGAGAATPRSLRSRRASRGGPSASVPRGMPHRHCVTRVLVVSEAELTMRRTITTVMLGLGMVAMTAAAQDMMRGVDLSSPDMVSAEMTRGELEAILARATATAPADFTSRRLSGLDLSGLDLSGVIFRAARLNKTNLSGTRLDRAVLDQAWMLEADLT